MTNTAPITPATVDHDAATALSGHCEGLRAAADIVANAYVKSPMQETKSAFASRLIREITHSAIDKRAQISRIYSREGQGDG